MFPRSLKIKIIHNLVQIFSTCSQGLATCRATRQHFSVALAPKQKSFFPSIALG